MDWEKYLILKNKLNKNASTTIAKDERVFLLRLVQDYLGENVLEFGDIYDATKIILIHGNSSG